ncbi:hypothetical protein R1sor_012635 [Riccia sorocarpa]|uniref:MD-2-related lipid-recognition domain-containing protein n=1 Tax=Riccia sorocarpa TaxID=122646 RepID=A0ABD3I686_9MARC
MAARAVNWILLFVSTVFVVGVNGRSISPLNSDFRPCSSWRKYPITIKDVLIDPDPVVSGDPVTFTVPATSNHELQGGTVIISVSLYGFKVHSERDDLCSKTQCPIKGDFELSSSQELPPLTPPGRYKVKFQVLDPDGIEQACATVGFTIIWRPPMAKSVTAEALRIEENVSSD